MTDYTTRAGLNVDASLAKLLERDVLTPLGRDIDAFWAGFADLCDRFVPRNRELLTIRETMQSRIDEWHTARQGQTHDSDAYRAFLNDIGYLVPEPGDFTIGTRNVDPEIATMAGRSWSCRS